MTMSRRNANGEETIVVAPQQRSPEAKQYLTMLTSMDRVLVTKRELDVDQLLELAQSRVGPVSLNADSILHLEGLRCLAGSIQRDSYYDEIGRRMANYYVYDWIRKYIVFERDLVTSPDILDVPVSKPLFLIGFGRTGSTFLHHLLALDPQSRTPRLWELLEPSPPPRPETYDTDPRIRRSQANLSFRSIVMPDLHKIHEFDAQAPEECLYMMWHGPQHVMLGLRSEDYWQWFRNLSSAQLHVLYKKYKAQVQHLQLFHRREHWLSKTLSHAYYLPVLFRSFPDARIVRLHRDPCQIIPALASLTAHAQVPYTKRIDFLELGQRMLNLFLDSMQRIMQSDKEESSEHFIDVLFDDLIRNPITTVRRIYSKFGYPYTEEFDSGLHNYSETESVSSKYRHAYTLEQFGLSRAQVIVRSEEYLDWVEQRTGSRLCRS
jgi:hypothetical protein